MFESGRVRCWGYAVAGQLGYGNQDSIGDDETPASAGDVEVGGSVAQLDGSLLQTCALLETGNVRCWGAGTQGELGILFSGTIGDDETPSSVAPIDLGGQAVRLATGSAHSCVVLDTGAVRCWGQGGAGRLGYGNVQNVGDDETPDSVGDVNIGGKVVSVSAGFAHTCALLETGAVRCWGHGGGGRLGYGNVQNIGDDEAPASAGDVDVGGVVKQIATGSYHTCALLSTGRSPLLGRRGAR